MNIRNFTIFIIGLSFVGCVSGSKTPDRAPTSQRSFVDYDFINNSIGKSFQYARPAANDGEPNCVAAALRAGGYVPAFVVSGTDDAYGNLLPICFKRKSLDEVPEEGDLGVVYVTKIPTLAHMVLFLDRDQIFEKPGPQNDQFFQISSWAVQAKKAIHEGFDAQVWTYSPGEKCPLDSVKRNFRANPNYADLNRIGLGIDSRIYNQSWGVRPDFTQTMIKTRLDQEQQKLFRFIKREGKNFNFKKSYPKVYEYLFVMNLLKTELRVGGN